MRSSVTSNQHAFEHSPLRRAAGAEPIELHVTDLDASERFYTALLGLTIDAESSSDPQQRTLTTEGFSTGIPAIILNHGDAPQASNAVLLELDSSSELLDRFLIAKLLNAPASALTSIDGCLSATVRDPDGHRIELRAVDSDAVAAGVKPDCARRWGRSEAYRPLRAARYGRIPTPRATRESSRPNR